jgi:uncharacterized surface protein with fasciclin (FAS1) repeats
MMRKRNVFALPVSLAVSLLALTISARPATAQEQEPPPPPPPPTQPVPVDPNAPQVPDVVDTAAKDVRFRRLVEAVKAAGLTETLKGKGPFTILAPTDSAFGRLPTGALDDLMKPENKEKLAAILKYHVLAGQFTAADIAKLGDNAQLKTLSGQTITLKLAPRVKLNNAGVIATDIAAGNGIIHVIDTVLVPPPPEKTPATTETAPPPPPSR